MDTKQHPLFDPPAHKGRPEDANRPDGIPSGAEACERIVVQCDDGQQFVYERKQWTCPSGHVLAVWLTQYEVKFKTNWAPPCPACLKIFTLGDWEPGKGHVPDRGFITSTKAERERAELVRSRVGFQQHCAESANKFADQRDEARRKVAELEADIKTLCAQLGLAQLQLAHAKNVIKQHCPRLVRETFWQQCKTWVRKARRDLKTAQGKGG